MVTVRPTWVSVAHTKKHNYSNITLHCPVTFSAAVSQPSEAAWVSLCPLPWGEAPGRARLSRRIFGSAPSAAPRAYTADRVLSYSTFYDNAASAYQLTHAALQQQQQQQQRSISITQAANSQPRVSLPPICQIPLANGAHPDLDSPEMVGWRVDSHVREHGEHLLSPYDPTDPAGAAGEAVGDFRFMHAQVLAAVLLLLLAEDAREVLAAAVRMRRGGANAWASAVGRLGRMGSRRRRVADLSSSEYCVLASSWGRPPIRRVHSSGSFCASTGMYVRLSVGIARWRVREV